MSSFFHLPLSWQTYDFFAVAGMFLLAIVGSQADNDLQLKRWESQGLRKARQVSFVVAELFLGFTVLVQGSLWEPSLIAAGNLVPGMLILAVNALSLSSRAPPGDRSGFYAYLANRLWHPLRSIAHRMAMHRSRPES